MGLAQIGEFSFIIASLGVTLKVTSSFLYPIAVAVSVLTTLLTPYLIKSSDGLVNWFDRKAPPPLVNSLELYTRWIGQIGSRQSPNVVAKMMRRWILQMGLNAALIAGVFIAAAFVGQRPPEWMKNLGLSTQWLKSALWLAAVFLSLPMFIATARKLQALGMLLAETKVTLAAAGPRTEAIRAVVANVIPIAGTVGLGLFVLVLSSTLLPPLNVLIVMLVIIGLIAWRLWRTFIKVYSKAQVALLETFAQVPAPRFDPAQVAMPSLLREADLETVTLTPVAPAVGKLIRELEVRTRTGASIVAIERGGVNTVNPGPDEELQVNDQVLLLGSPAQLEKARRHLLGGEPAS
jgi:CPA2 family monovalent cation:H+ antiporter-2